MSNLREAAKLFYNLTIADPEVIIRPPNAQKQAAIVAAGQTLTAALALTDTESVAQEPIGQKMKGGSICWASDDAMFGYVGPLYATQQPAITKTTGDKP